MDSLRRSPAAALAAAKATTLLHALLHALPAFYRLSIAAVEFFKKLFATLQRFGVVFDLFQHALALLGGWAFGHGCGG